MIPRLNAYERVVGKGVVERIRRRAEPLRGRQITHINATSSGGGVAEILNTLVFLLNDVGIKTDWRVLIGNQSFFKVTKQMHNALQGQKWHLGRHHIRTYKQSCARNAIINQLDDRDAVVVHDPQPLGMIAHYPNRKGRWLWRCHIDTSHPHQEVLDFLLPYIRSYDGVIASMPQFRVRGYRGDQQIIHPSIDPLSEKNREMSVRKAREIVRRKGVNPDLPLLLQVSRFDPWKDHQGVLEIYERVRERTPCQLVLIGGTASDDPQGPQVYHALQRRAEGVPDVHLFTEKNDRLVNALQRLAQVVFQNSIREGFALTVSEAMWKHTPVIATPVGGIPLQVIDNKTGFLIRSRKAGVEACTQLLRDVRLRERMGRAGHEHVLRNFLITRHVLDYVELLRRVLT